MIDREIEKEGIPVAYITAMTNIARHTGATRIITGFKLPYPCGNPDLPDEADRALRRRIVECALSALQTDVRGPTVFVPGSGETTKG